MFEPQSVSALIEELRRGDPTAQRRLLREYWDTPHRRALGVLRHRADADDVAMGVLADFMMRHVHTFRGTTGAALRAWLGAVASHRALAVLARRHLGAEVDVEVEAGVAPADAPIDPWLLERLEQCLREVPEGARKILRLRYAAGWNNAAVAALLGMSRAHVGRLLLHPQKGVLARLRRCILRGTGGRS